MSELYVWKQKAIRIFNPHDEQKKIILHEVSIFLDGLSESKLIVSRRHEFLAIHPESQKPMFDEAFKHWKHEPKEETTTIHFETDVCDLETKDEIENVLEEYGEYSPEICEIAYESPEIINYKDDDGSDSIITGETKGDWLRRKIRESKSVVEAIIRYNCWSCDSSFLNASSLRVHYLKKHEKEKIAPKNHPKRSKDTTLTEEQKLFLKNEVLDRRVIIESTHGPKYMWKCRECDFTGVSDVSFRIHMKREHLSSINFNNCVVTEESNEICEDDRDIVEQKLWVREQVIRQKQMTQTADGPKMVWTCSQCSFSSSNRGRFRIHVQRNHTNLLTKGPNKHSCHECRLRFDGENHLVVHNNSHKIFDLTAPYAIYPSCAECRMFFCADTDLLIHENRHSENPELLFDAMPCVGVMQKNGEVFMSVSDEIVRDVPDEIAVRCGHCLRTFGSETEVKHHLMLHHCKSFACPFDGRVFNGIPTLSYGIHLRQIHPEIFPDLRISCSFCRMDFETIYSKLKHMKICKEKQYCCDHCGRNYLGNLYLKLLTKSLFSGKSFFKKTELLHHLKVVLGLTVFACHYCGKSHFKDQGDLKTHIRSHTNERPYPCPICPKTYKTSSARASHVESHMDAAYECSVCQVKFRRRILYQRHMKLLHDETYRKKAFEENTCRICNKSYLRRSHYKNHLKTHITL